MVITSAVYACVYVFVYTYMRASIEYKFILNGILKSDKE